MEGPVPSRRGGIPKPASRLDLRGAVRQHEWLRIGRTHSWGGVGMSGPRALDGQSNPFAVRTPESLEPNYVNSVFVDVFTDFLEVPQVGHTFIRGPRGSGKSMMFRYLEPDCEQLRRTGSLRGAP